MPGSQHVTSAFRAQLKRELIGWREEGLLDATAERSLIQRYRLDESPAPLALQAVYVLGALLIGGGVMAFIAWNWDAMGPAVKIGVPVSMMVAAYVAGHLLQSGGSRPRLGEALTFLGTLLVGANLGVVAQVFNISSDWYSGLGAWAVGTVAAALLLQSKRSADLAIVLGLFWCGGYLEGHRESQLYLPYVFAALCVVPALALRSRWTSALALMAGGIAILIPPAGHSGSKFMFGGTVLALAALYSAIPLLTSERDSLGWGRVSRRLGLIALVGTAYLFSFREIAEYRHYEAHSPLTLITLLPLAAAAVIATLRLPSRWWQREPLFGLVLGSVALLVGAFSQQAEISTVVVANLVLVALCAGMLATSVRTLDRGQFWAGNVVGGVLIVSRFFELETDLWMKALAFIGAGVAIILIGLAFERRLKHIGVAHVG